MSLQEPSRAGLVSSSIVVLFCFLAGSQAFGQVVSEDQVKAAYIYSFAKFIEWPSHTFAVPGASLRFCVLNDGPLQAELDRTVKDRLVGGRTIEVLPIHAADQARSCHLVFIGSSQSQPSRQIIEAFRGLNILTIGETASFIDGGGMIGFLFQDNHVYFEINHKEAALSGLYVSSRLLSVAKRIIE